MLPGCIKEGDINYAGKDIAQPIQLESHQACAEHCISVEGGLFWTYSRSTKNCYVKSSDSGRKAQGPLVSGTRACGLRHQLVSLGVAVSQQWKDNYPALQCIDSNPQTFCAVAEAPFPWLAIYLLEDSRGQGGDMEQKRLLWAWKAEKLSSSSHRFVAFLRYSM